MARIDETAASTSTFVAVDATHAAGYDRAPGPPRSRVPRQKGLDVAPTTKTMHDWLKVHRSLIDAEAKFGEMAVDFANGTVTQAELDAQQRHVEALRALSKAVFDAAVSGLGKR